ncbi:MAG TPA: hypothetical protein VGW38_20190, partial [Chloroflexota bacterium]|nr:hypothetical protein [Chloroflexota bacterium]
MDAHLSRCAIKFSHWRRGRLLLFFAVLTVYLTSPVVTVTDSRLTVPTALSVVREFDLDLDEFQTVAALGPAYDIVERRGHKYGYFPYGPAILAVPPVLALEGLKVAGLGGGTEALINEDNAWAVEVVTASVVTAATAVVLQAIAFLVLSGSQRRRWWLSVGAALVFAFATPAWSTATRALWQHGPTMFFQAVALLLAVRSRTKPESARWMGVPLVLAYVMRPTAAILVASLSLWVVLRRRAFLLHFAVSGLVVAVLFAAVNYVSYGTILPPYFDAGRLGGRGVPLEALAGTLVSPSRGLLVFSPVLILAVAGVVVRVRSRRFDALDAAVVTSVVMFWLSISAFPHWWGGNAYGPRLLTDVVPMLLYLLLPVVDAIPNKRWSDFLSHQRVFAAVCSVLLILSVVNHAQG